MNISVGDIAITEEDINTKTPKNIQKIITDSNCSDKNLVIQNKLNVIKQQEKQQQDNNEPCLICFDCEPDAINLPCGHGGICYECGISLMEKTEECYLCRKKVTEILQMQIQEKQNKQHYVIKQGALLVNNSVLTDDINKTTNFQNQRINEQFQDLC